MKLSDHFKQLLGDISLNPARVDRIDSAYETWNNILENDDEIKEKYLDFSPKVLMLLKLQLDLRSREKNLMLMLS